MGGVLRHDGGFLRLVFVFVYVWRENVWLVNIVRESSAAALSFFIQ